MANRTTVKRSVYIAIKRLAELCEKHNDCAACPLGVPDDEQRYRVTPCLLSSFHPIEDWMDRVWEVEP